MLFLQDNGVIACASADTFKAIKIDFINACAFNQLEVVADFRTSLQPC